MRRTWSVTMLVAACLLVVVGCAKPPETEIQMARSAIEAAKSADAGEYAQASLSRAEDAMRALEAELKVQEEKMGLFRSYKEAIAKAADVKAAAEQAATDAAAGKEQARVESENAIASAQGTIDATKMLVENAPAGKGTAADIAALKSDLMAAEATLADAQSAHDGGRFKDATAKAMAASSSADQVKMAIEAAMAARGAAGRS